MNDVSYVLDALGVFIEDTENNFNPEEVTGKDVLTWLGGFITGMRCASRTQLKVGFTLGSRLGLVLRSRSAMPSAKLST